MIVASTANHFVRHLRNLFRIPKLKVKGSSVMVKANWNIPPGKVVLPQENNRMSYVPHKNIYFPSDHTLQLSACLGGRWFYRQLEVDIRYALETNNNSFIGREYSPWKTLGKLYNVNKREIKTAMQPILKKKFCTAN